MKNETTTETSKRGKENYNKSGKLLARRNKLKLEANARQTEYDRLSIQQKIDLAKSRRGESKRELERLTKALKKGKNEAKQ